MKPLGICALVLLSCAILVPRAPAGLYIPGEPLDLPLTDAPPRALPFDVFRLKLRTIMSIPVPQPESELRRHYLTKRDDLLRRRLEQLSSEELVSLSGYLIRLRESQRAMEVLQFAARKFPNDFLVLANQALLFHMEGRPDVAQVQYGLLQLKPRELPGFAREQTQWLLRAERALFDVQKLRLRERREQGIRATAEDVDNLFQLTFIGDGGSYEAGTLAASERAKLPDDAIALVQQLLLWLPDDARLYWLLGELYNATGDLPAADAIFDECIGERRFQTEKLREHRRMVKDALAAGQAPRAEDERDWRRHPEAFWIVGAVLFVPLLLLVYWQLREIRRRISNRVRPK